MPWMQSKQLIIKIIIIVIFYLFFRAAPTAYGNSQARSRIGAIAASHSHSHSFLFMVCNPWGRGKFVAPAQNQCSKISDSPGGL